MSLNSELAKLKEENFKKVPKELADILLKDIEIKVKRGITKNALKIGDKIPEFALENAVGRKIYSDELLSNGPLIISFYRGAWCPYCNMELVAYQRALPEIIEAGGQLVAISPELPDASVSLMERHTLEYEILSDMDNKVAKQFGLVFRVDDKVLSVYKQFGIDLEKSQGNSNFELPFPATYVVNSDGTILEAVVNYDYTNRLDPYDAIEVINTCAY